MKRIFFLSFWFFAVNFAAAGPVESYYIESYERMGLFIREALVTEAANLSTEEKAALVKVQSHLYKELPSDQALDFSWPPSHFTRTENSCPVAKIAITGTQPATKIYLNRAIFYGAVDQYAVPAFEGAISGALLGSQPTSQSELDRITQWALSGAQGPREGKVPSVYFSEAVQTIFHELGHHYDYLDHQWLNALGAKVARAAVRLLQRESGNIDRYLARGANGIPRADAFVDLSLFDNLDHKVPREEVAGVFYTLGIGLGAKEKGRLYFLPNGEERGLIVGIAAQAPVDLIRKEMNAVGQGFPFRGYVEKVWTGRAVRTSGRTILMPSSAPDYMAVSNLWAAPNPRTGLEEAIVGKIFLGNQGSLYLDLRQFKDRRRLGLEFLTLEFPDPEIRRRVVQDLADYPIRSSAIVFPMDPLEKRAEGWVARVATVNYFRDPNL